MQRGDADAWTVNPQIQSKITTKDEEKKGKELECKGRETDAQSPEEPVPKMLQMCVREEEKQRKSSPTPKKNTRIQMEPSRTCWFAA